MHHILYQYRPVDPTTWVYLSALLTVAIYFKFSRFWSVRNLDLVLLFALSPGLLLVNYGVRSTEAMAEQLGYIWLFVTGGLIFVRLLVDPLLVRRPLLEPNLSTGGLTFIGVALLVFLMGNVFASDPSLTDLDGAMRLEQILSRSEGPVEESNLERHGPAFPILHLLASLPPKALVLIDGGVPDEADQIMVRQATAVTAAILSHLGVVIGLVLIGAWHFDNINTGIAAATLYLLLPYTAQMTSRVDHVLPAALLVWAVASYRRPLISGMMLGLAAGAVYFPVFLLPLWLGFYRQRGWKPFCVGMVSTAVLLTATLAFTSSNVSAFLAQTWQMLDFTHNLFLMENASGFWAIDDSIFPYRIPVLVTFLLFSISLSIWPPQKNLGTLLSCSAAVMLGTQFLHDREGGLYMAWYVPLLLLTVFRPNLQDRVALTVLGQGWLGRRRRVEPDSIAA